MIPKRGEELPGVGFHFSSAPLKAEWCGERLGLGLFPAALWIGRLTMPWDWRGYVNERLCEEEEEDFRKRTELAAELIRSFVSPLESRVIVVVGGQHLTYGRRGATPAIRSTLWDCSSVSGSSPRRS